jgi:hypothetical protein
LKEIKTTKGRIRNHDWQGRGAQVEDNSTSQDYEGLFLQLPHRLRNTGLARRRTDINTQDEPIAHFADVCGPVLGRCATSNAPALVPL